MESVARWIEGLRFEGIFSDGHRVDLDTPVESGGSGTGPRPVEMLLIGLAGCTGMDVITILKKKRQAVSSFRVRVRGERPEEHPRVFTKIHVEYEIGGKGIDPGAVQQAIHLSESKYCSVSAMLRQAVPITSEIRIEEESIPPSGGPS